MQTAEFQLWIDHHRTAFTGFSEWLSRHPDRLSLLGIWQRLLRNVELADAKAATEALLSGEEPEPMGYDRHVRSVLSYAKNHRTIRLAEAAHEPSYRDAVSCLTCKDSGVVVVWGIKSMEAVVRGNFGLSGTLYETGVPCICKAGDMLARRDAARLGVPEYRLRYNPSLMLIASWILTDMDGQAKLREFVEALRPTREVAYVQQEAF